MAPPRPAGPLVRWLIEFGGASKDGTVVGSPVRVRTSASFDLQGLCSAGCLVEGLRGLREVYSAKCSKRNRPSCRSCCRRLPRWPSPATKSAPESRLTRQRKRTGSGGSNRTMSRGGRADLGATCRPADLGKPHFRLSASSAKRAPRQRRVNALPSRPFVRPCRNLGCKP
jgi:hypothetical protein